MSHFIHPCLPRDPGVRHTGIMNLDTGEFEVYQGDTKRWGEITQDFDAFRSKLRRSEEWRRRLGIPDRTYHAFGFPRWGYNLDHIRNLVEWARGHNIELRIWVNEQSALLLLVFADPDMSEGTGWQLYQYVKQNASSYKSYGLSNWFEFCQFGTPVFSDWPIIERSDLLFVSSPDGKKIVAFE